MGDGCFVFRPEGKYDFSLRGDARGGVMALMLLERANVDKGFDDGVGRRDEVTVALTDASRSIFIGNEITLEV